MAKAPKRPKSIGADDWFRMSEQEKVRQLHRVGEAEAGKRASRLVGRNEYASKDPRRKVEAKVTGDNTKKFVKKVSNPRERAKMGGKAIVSYNKKLNSAGRMVGGKRVYMAGSEEAMKKLKSSIQEALKLDSSQAKKLAQRLIKRGK